MALPSLDLFCVSISQYDTQLCISFPGGAEICAMAGYDFGDAEEISKSLIAQLNAGMAPLVPIFNILEVVLLIFKCVKAVPDSLGPPPNPTKILECIPELQKQIDKILKMIPALSLPALARSLIDVVVEFLRGLKVRLQSMINKQLAIIAGYTKASALEGFGADLALALDCGQANLDAQLVNMNQQMKPLNRFFGIVNAILQIAGVGCLPAIGSIGALTGDILSPIDTLIQLLLDIKNAIPDIPGLSLGGSSAC